MSGKASRTFTRILPGQSGSLTNINRAFRSNCKAFTGESKRLVYRTAELLGAAFPVVTDPSFEAFGENAIVLELNNGYILILAPPDSQDEDGDDSISLDVQKRAKNSPFEESAVTLRMANGDDAWRVDVATCEWARGALETPLRLFHDNDDLEESAPRVSFDRVQTLIRALKVL